MRLKEVPIEALHILLGHTCSNPCPRQRVGLLGSLGLHLQRLRGLGQDLGWQLAEFPPKYQPFKLLSLRKLPPGTFRPVGTQSRFVPKLPEKVSPPSSVSAFSSGSSKCAHVLRSSVGHSSPSRQWERIGLAGTFCKSLEKHKRHPSHAFSCGPFRSLGAVALSEVLATCI